MNFEPRIYQRPMIVHELEVERGGLWAGMGLGKTASTLRTLDAIQMVEPGPALVLAPLRVAQSTWPDEAQKWDNLRNIVVSPIVGTAEQRLAALNRDASVYTINYENVPWLVDVIGDDWPFATVVADESTRLKGYRIRNGGVRAQALAHVARFKVRRWINLTGTPSPNGLIDLWGQTWFLDQGARLGRTFEAFKERWFKPVFSDADSRRVTWQPQAHAQEEITGRLRDICLSVKAADHFKLPPLITNTIYVDLPAPAMQTYRRMEREMYAEIAGSPVEAFNAAARTIKCLQVANGAAYIDPDGIDEERANVREWREVHDVKLQALESVVNEAAGQPVMVAPHFKSDTVRILRTFPQARVLDKDPQTIRDWNARKIPLLIAHPESAGHGLNLQDGGNILVFFGHWWALEPHEQIIERIGPTRQAQSGRTTEPVYVHYIVARHTVDELVMKRRETKRAVNELLMEAMKR
jgi:SNF2 family DNA or RNA helicase